MSTDAPAPSIGRCRVCGGPLAPELAAVGRHEVNPLEDDPPEIAAYRDAGRKMAARQRLACARGRIAATRLVPDGWWVAAATPGQDGYPCRCGEFDDWQHSRNRCACQGRTDTAGLPPTCCAYVAPAPAVEVVEVVEEPAAPADLPEPTSTVQELWAVLIDYELARPRTRQVTPGPSELGTPCLAQLVRKLAGMPRRDLTDPAWAPFAGTAVHAEMEKVVAHWNATIGRQRWIAEDVLDCGEGITGHGDAFDLDQAMVVDWKYCGATALSKLYANQRAGRPPAQQVSQDYRIQAHLYGAGHAAKGRKVDWVRLVLLPRSWRYDDAGEWTERYDPALATWALERYREARGLVDALDLANRPAHIGLVPRTPTECNWCPFHRPGAPNDGNGCPGDDLRTVKCVERVAAGLVTTATSNVI